VEVLDAYVAGLIDGEGTITLSHDNSGDAYRAPVVSMTSTTRELVDLLHDEYGGSGRASLILARYKVVTPRNGKYSEIQHESKNSSSSISSSTLVRHSLSATGAYESLARLRLSASQDGVAMAISRVRFHRLSPLFTRLSPAEATLFDRTPVHASTL